MKTQDMLVCILNSPSKYRDSALFAEFARMSDADVTIFYHSIRNASEMEDLKKAPYISFKLDTNIFRNRDLIATLRKARVANKTHNVMFFIAGWAAGTNVFLILVLGLLGIRYMLWTDTVSTRSRTNNIRETLRQWYLKFIMRRAFCVGTTGTPGLHAMAELNNFGAPAHNFVDFPLYVDIDKYAPIDKRVFLPSLYTRDYKIKIVVVGWLIDSLKGQSVILRALSVVKGIREFVVSFIGVGPDLEELKELSRELNLQGQVEFSGYKDPDSLIQIYRQSDILIHASPVHEPYGVVVLEAMAAGLVVFASDCTCAALDRIEQGRNGFVHSAGDFEMLASQLLPFFRDPASLADARQRSFLTSRQWPLRKGADQLASLLAGRRFE